ncbi:MAG: DUF2778 domain-containing protein [Roseibium sp.]|nr:DUF2778 domain-containing protein [Roseibium sp.]
MLGKKQETRRKTGQARKSDRTFFTVLAAATLLMSGFAAMAVWFGTSLSPVHLSADNALQSSLNLSQGVQAALDTEEMTPQVRVSAMASTSQAAAIFAQTSVDMHEIEWQKAEAARQAAKSALAVKLARLKLARALHDSRMLADQAARLAEVETPLPTPTVSVAALQTVGAAASASAEMKVDPVSNQFAGLVATTPAKPGAIVPPPPGAKPTPPRRLASADKPTRSSRPEATSPVLAYANPGNPTEDEDGAFSGIGKLFNGSRGGLPHASRGIAVYDISAATVYMPDGTKLEAHSGIGHRKDNPKYAYVKNLGPTPPNVYKLRMRERRFHGVEAIRMLPYDRAAMKGRDGMLAHTPLLRRSNGSHGCVAFKHYAKFLKAFKAGKVKTMIVVPSMNELPTYMAKLERKKDA